MFILHFTRSANHMGGAPVIINLLAKNNSEFKSKLVGLFSEKKNNWNLIELNFLIPMTDDIYLHGHILKKTTAALLRKTLFLRVYLFLRRTKPDIIHFHFSKYVDVFIKAALKLNIPFIWTAHHLLDEGFKKDSGIKDLQNHSKLKIIAVSNAVKEDILFINPNLKVDIIYNGLDQERLFCNYQNINFRLQLGIPENHVVFCGIGRLNYEKGYDIFLEAANEISKEYKQISFILAGTGPLKNKFSSYIIEHFPNANFHLIGYQNDVNSLLQSSDVFIAPSRQESFGLSLLEAMAAGKLCIASKVGGMPEVLGKSGLYFEKTNISELYNLMKIIINEPLILLKYSSLAKEHASKFTTDKMLNEYNSIYKSLV
jgi:1,4-alpha-glucan branching enzyme